MSIDINLPNDATHYFLWWDGLHVYKKDGKNWLWLINGEWRDIPVVIPVRWWFGYHVEAEGYKHKLHKVNWT